MNILYVTYLSNNKWAGPNNSVPRQIKAQSKNDDVCWLNLSKVYTNDEDIKKEVTYINGSDLRKDFFDCLPPQFKKPDIVIFEGVYFYKFIKVYKECIKKDIPYIIIPRSSLTAAGQQSKKIKKKLGNFLFFNKFINRADGIQYLTEKEMVDSGDLWNDYNFVIPNGIDKQQVKNFTDVSSKLLKGSFIGRADIYQKGLDKMMDSLIINKDQLKDKVFINLYCPDSEDKIKLKEIIKEKKIDNLVKMNNAVFSKDKFKVLKESDFFIQTSRFEGHSMGLIEALSFGVPCIVTEGTNIADEIKLNNAGWDAGNTEESISGAIFNMIENKDKLDYFSKNAHDLSLIYSWDTISKKSSEEFQKILISRGN